MHAGAGDNAVRVFCEDAAAADQEPGQPPSWSLVAEQQQAHPLDVNCVRWHPTTKGLLASAGDDMVIKLWSFQPAGEASKLPNGGGLDSVAS